MARLIDADKALKIVYEQAAERPDEYYLFDYAALVLQEAPTIDAVEVVRCRDCEVPHNKYTGCPNLNGLVTSPNFYCPFGKRKSGSGNG